MSRITMTTGLPNLALQLAGEIVAAYAGANKIKAEKLPELLGQVYTTIAGLSEEGASYRGASEPAVPISKSVTPDSIICLEDGKPLKMLKRYIRTHFNLSPDEYRRKWGLPADYPMTAPNYAKSRSQLAKSIGLGRKPAAPVGKKTKKAKAVRKKQAA